MNVGAIPDIFTVMQMRTMIPDAAFLRTFFLLPIAIPQLFYQGARAGLRDALLGALNLSTIANHYHDYPRLQTTTCVLMIVKVLLLLPQFPFLLPLSSRKFLYVANELR